MTANLMASAGDFPLPKPKSSDPFASTIIRLLCYENQEIAGALIAVSTAQPNDTWSRAGAVDVLASLLRVLEGQKLLLTVLKKEFQRDPLELLTRHEGRIHELISRYMQLSCRTYLRKIFHPIIANLTSDVNYYEIPQATGSQKYPLTTSKVLSTIFVSQTYIPTLLRKVVRELVVESLPSLLPSPALPVVAKILFVRLFAAALRRPSDYGLCDSQLSVQTQYVLHKVANRLEKMSKAIADESSFKSSLIPLSSSTSPHVNANNSSGAQSFSNNSSGNSIPIPVQSSGVSSSHSPLPPSNLNSTQSMASGNTGGNSIALNGSTSGTAVTSPFNSLTPNVNETTRNNFLLMNQFLNDFLNTSSSFTPVKEPRLEHDRVDIAVLFCALEKNVEKISNWLGTNIASEDRSLLLKRKLRDELKVVRYAASQQSFFLAGEYERLSIEVPAYLSKHRPGDSPIEIVHSAVVQIIQIFKEYLVSGCLEVTVERWDDMVSKKALQPVGNLLRDLRESSLTSLSELERTVFFLNLFNALMVKSFLKHGIPDTSTRSLWMRSNRCCLDERNYTLADIELILLTPSSKSEKDSVVKDHLRKYLVSRTDMRLNFAMARGIRSNSLLRAYTPENFSHELDAVTSSYLESTISIDPIRKEICLPPLFEQRQSDFLSVSTQLSSNRNNVTGMLLEWLQPHLMACRLRTAAELLYKDVSSVKVLFDYDSKNNLFYYRIE